MKTNPAPPSKGIPALIPFLVFVCVLFIGILVYTYVESKKANPQMIPLGQVTNSTQVRA